VVKNSNIGKNRVLLIKLSA